MNNLNHKIIHSSCLKNSRILVVGMGQTGASISEYLLNKGLSFRVMDTRENPSNLEQFKNKNIEIVLGGLFEEHFIWADTIILSPGISENETVIKNAREKGKAIVGDIELFLHEVNVPVVAITGSNGKSTVTSMMACIGEHANNMDIAIGGNIGIPALKLLKTESDLVVLELSSFQLESTESMIFSTSVILNLSEDHMDRYDSFDDYCKAKLKLLNGGSDFILNFDDTVIKKYSKLYKSKNINWFTLNEPTESQYGIVQHQGSKWICVNEAGKVEKLFNCTDLNVVGDHNITNAMVALMISRLAGIDDETIITGLINFNGLSHRSQLIRNSNNVKWINDSKATNVGATSAAIVGFKECSLILIMGGQSKGQDFSVLNTVIKSNVKLVILFGEDAELINSSLEQRITRTVKIDLDAVVKLASETVKAGDVVLFSPACASFDMFDNFEHRGDSFVKLVEGVPL